MTRDRLHRASERWFRLLLRLYPAFRDEMGNAVVDAYCRRADQARARGGVMRLARVWLAALSDVTGIARSSDRSSARRNQESGIRTQPWPRPDS
jgi:hypothetical protein